MKTKITTELTENKLLYEKYHNRRMLQKRILTKKNFTYRYLINVLENRLKNVRNVLDIGCGTGAIDFYLANNGISVVGIDISTKAVRNARLNAKNFGLALKTKFNINHFPHDKIEGKYDLVICSEVLEHLVDDSKAVNKIFELLKSGGLAVLSSPSINSPIYKLGLARNHDKEVGHLRRYNNDNLLLLLRKAGFKIVDSRKVQGLLREALFIFPLGELIIKMANRFSFVSDFLSIIDELLLVFGESDIIVTAKKV
jgi:2-polyprenyl-3-methyl-5-hydroxy-6-metoxy-1,4-benzoquinol methylase